MCGPGQSFQIERFEYKPKCAMYAIPEIANKFATSQGQILLVKILKQAMASPAPGLRLHACLHGSRSMRPNFWGASTRD